MRLAPSNHAQDCCEARIRTRLGRPSRISGSVSRTMLKVAAGLGFEPRLMEPKPIVLPLHHPAMCFKRLKTQPPLQLPIPMAAAVWKHILSYSELQGKWLKFVLNQFL